MIVAFPTHRTMRMPERAPHTESRAPVVNRTIREHCQRHGLSVDDTRAAIAQGLAQLTNGATAVGAITAGKQHADRLRKARDR
jgi:hypothetical protein